MCGTIVRFQNGIGVEPESMSFLKLSNSVLPMRNKVSQNPFFIDKIQESGKFH